MKLASLLVLIATLASAQLNNNNAPMASSPLDYRLAAFELKDATFVEAVSQLSQQPVDGLHLGLEEVLREKITEAVLIAPHFSLSLHNVTVRVLIDTLCDFDSRYTWKLDGRTINIYPKTTMGDDTYLLNRRLERIVVTAIPDPEEGLTFLDKQLPPPREQLGYAGAGGDPSYEAPWTVGFDDVTVRQFINRLSEHMGPHTSWVLAGAKQERFFSFHKGGFH